MLAYVHGIQNDHAAEERTLLKLLEGSRAAGEDVGAAWALCNLAGIYEDRGDILLSDKLDLEAREAYLKIGYQQAALWQTRNLAQKEFYRGNVLSARRDLESAARELHAMDNIALMKTILWDLAYIAFRQGQYDQTERYEQEIADSPRKTANLDEERLLYKIRKGIQAYFKGELETARRLYEVALVTLEEMRWDAFAGNTMINYGLVLLRSGPMEEALPYFARGAEKLGEVGRGGQTSNAWYGLAEYHRLTGDLPASIAHFQEALFLRNRYQGYINIPDIFDGLAKVVLQQGDLDCSARWFGFAESLRIRFGIALQPVDRPDREKNVQSLKARMPAADLSSAWEAGDRMNLEEAVAQALEGYVHGGANGEEK
jgi:tetratricopeptide (TPR) repeat protein